MESIQPETEQWVEHRCITRRHGDGKVSQTEGEVNFLIHSIILLLIYT